MYTIKVVFKEDTVRYLDGPDIIELYECHGYVRLIKDECVKKCLEESIANIVKYEGYKSYIRTGETCSLTGTKVDNEIVEFAILRFKTSDLNYDVLFAVNANIYIMNEKGVTVDRMHCMHYNK